LTNVKAFTESPFYVSHSGRELDRAVVRRVFAEKIHSASLAAVVVPKLAETKENVSYD